MLGFFSTDVVASSDSLVIAWNNLNTLPKKNCYPEWLYEQYQLMTEWFKKKFWMTAKSPIQNLNDIIFTSISAYIPILSYNW